MNYYDKRIKVEIKWDVRGSELTFLEFVDLPTHTTQQEFLAFCIKTVERAKKLGREEEKSE